MQVGEAVVNSGTFSGTFTTFQWTIDFDCFINKDTGQKVGESPTFHTSCCQQWCDEWKLLLFKSFHPGYIALYLSHLTDCREVNVEYSFSVLDQNNERLKPCIVEYKFVGTRSTGVSMFVEESFITDPMNKILKNNKLDILCTISTKENINQSRALESVKNLYRLKEFDRFEKLLKNKDFSDVTISAGGKNFYLHKCILTTSSEVFEAMFRNDMIEKNQNVVYIEDIKYEVLQKFFQFIYTGNVNEINETICELLIAADKYCVVELKAMCEETMSIGLNEQNVIKYLDLAIMNNAKKLKKAAINLISTHLENFIKDPEFEKQEKQNPGLLLEIIKKHFSTEKII